MDVDTDMREYFQLLENQKQMLLRAKSRKGECPRDRKPRLVAYSQFMMMHMSIAAKSNGDEEHMIHSAFIPPAYPPCTTSTAELQPITIKQLRLETHHRGTYLLLRSITPPNRMTSILVIAEDVDDDVVLLQMYHQEEEPMREITDIADVGTLLLVKEPYFKFTASGDYALRVDHLSDVVRLDAANAMVPACWKPRLSEMYDSVEPHKKKGDASVGKQKWWRAMHEYSEAITVGGDPDRIEIIKRNRSLAYLKTKQYDAALLDTNWPHFGGEPAEKALFRAAEALYHLRRYAESIEALEMLHTRFPGNIDAHASLKRASNRLAEELIGQYDFNTLQREAKHLRPPHLDRASYIGPIEIKHTATKGRGLFVTEAVKAGDMLLCEKAFAHAYAPSPGEQGNSKTTLLMNIERERGFMGGQADLIRIVAQKLFLNPSLAPVFTSLYHGDYKSTTVACVDGSPIVDTFLVERIMSLNVFGCPTSSLSSHKSLMKEESPLEGPKAYRSCGIWPKASLINHSCTSTARRAFIGDMMIVRATRDMAAGEELTFWYQVPQFKVDMKEELKSWGFECECAICEDVKQTKQAIKKERTKLHTELQKVAKGSATTAVKLERLINKMDATYTRSAEEVPRLGLWDAQMFLARMCLDEGNISKAFKAACKVLTLLGFVIDASQGGFEVKKWGLMVDHLVDAFFLIKVILIKLREVESAKKAEAYAKTAFKIVVGEDASFEKTYAGREI